ncbi:MAG: hypothetical protein L6420_08255 [Elusimicrobia bacterium]|nr:hypothetical protein [Elusimicrobiota bacterium]
MNFFKLRILNALLLFIIGILLGFIIKDKIFSPKDGRSPASAIITKTNKISSNVDSLEAKDGKDEILDEKEEYNVFDDEEAYDVSSQQQKSEKTLDQEKENETPTENEDDTVKFVDLSEPFFANPNKFKNEIVTMDIQMIFARKVDSGWRLNLMYVDSQKGVKYVYLDSDLILSDKIELKIGYFYRVSFKCVKGELNQGNTLLSIKFTGKKADWATGISAVE